MSSITPQQHIPASLTFLHKRTPVLGYIAVRQQLCPVRWEVGDDNCLCRGGAVTLAPGVVVYAPSAYPFKGHVHPRAVRGWGNMKPHRDLVLHVEFLGDDVVIEYDGTISASSLRLVSDDKKTWPPAVTSVVTTRGTCTLDARGDLVSIDNAPASYEARTDGTHIYRYCNDGADFTRRLWPFKVVVRDHAATFHFYELDKRQGHDVFYVLRVTTVDHVVAHAEITVQANMTFTDAARTYTPISSVPDPLPSLAHCQERVDSCVAVLGSWPWV
jgi:hypothetical protein